MKKQTISISDLQGVEPRIWDQGKNTISGNVSDLKKLTYVKIVKTVDDLPLLKDITSFIQKDDGFIEINKILYSGDDSIINTYTGIVRLNCFGKTEKA